MTSRWLTADRPLIIAHRGSSASAPENTMAAFRRAAADDADGIELDVRRSADDRLVVIHDARVDRTTDRAGAVADLPAERIRRVDAGGRFGPAFAGERIPLLNEVLEFARGRLLVDIEVKEPDLDALVIADVRAAGMEDSVLITSFLPEVLTAVAGQAPDLPVGLLFERGGAEAARSVDAAFMLPAIGAASDELVAACRRQGARVIVWTARTDADVRRAAALDVDGVIADDPLLVRRILA